MKRALSVLLGLAVVSCAAIIDIPELRAPDGTTTVGGGGADACAATGAANLVVTPRGIHTALDASHVYFTRGDPPTNNAILRCGKCGCDSPEEIVKKIGTPGALAVDDEAIYWTESSLITGTVNRVPKSDPIAKRRIAPLEQPFALALDETYLYYTVLGGSSTASLQGAGVWRAKKQDLSEPTQLTKTDAKPNDENILPYALAVDATHVYFAVAPDLTERPEEPCNGSRGRIRRVRKDGPANQTPETLATGQACPVAIVVHDDSISWATFGVGTASAGSIFTLPKSGGTPKLLAQEQGRPTSIAFRNGRVIWNTPANQRVVSCTAPACDDLDDVAASQVNPSGVSADASGIYWVVLGTIAQNFTDGALRRAAP